MNFELNRAHDFVMLAKAILKSGGSSAALQALSLDIYNTPANVRTIIKATSTSGTLSDPDFLAQLAPYKEASDGFIESLRAASVFDRLLADSAFRQVPLRTKLSCISSVALGSTVPEAMPTPVWEMSMGDATLEALKAIGLVVVSEELVRSTTDAAQALLLRELRGAVAAATDASFLSALLAGITPTASAGATAVQIAADVETLLAAVAPKAGSRLYLVTDTTTAGKLATKTDTAGVPVFPGVSPVGCELFSIPLLVSDQMPVDSDGSALMLIDAAGIAADSGLAIPSVATQASLQMDTAPDATSTASTVLVSLWQRHQRALKVERYWGAEKFRATAVAAISGVAY
jgi:hypothetical protein